MAKKGFEKNSRDRANEVIFLYYPGQEEQFKLYLTHPLCSVITFPYYYGHASALRQAFENLILNNHNIPIQEIEQDDKSLKYAKEKLLELRICTYFLPPCGKIN